MSKLIPPYKCAFSLNHAILNEASNIAFKAGVLSNEGFFPTEEDKISGVKTLILLKGDHLTPSQFKGLALGEVIPGHEEANRLARIYRKLHKMDPSEEDFFLAFEEAYFPEGIPSRMGRKASDFPYPLPLTPRIEPMIKALRSFIKSSEGKTHPLYLSGMAYIEILSIAPYSSGNEALALLVAKAILSRYTKKFLYLPLEEYMQKRKEALDKAIDESCEKANMAPFMLEYLGVIASALSSLLSRKEKKNKQTSPQVSKLLQVMEEGKFYTANELCEMLKLKSRLGLMKNYVNPALAGKYIKRSDPTSITSRNQRYGKA